MKIQGLGKSKNEPSINLKCHYIDALVMKSTLGMCTTIYMEIHCIMKIVMVVNIDFCGNYRCSPDCVCAVAHHSILNNFL